MKPTKRGIFDFTMLIIAAIAVATALYYYKKSSQQSTSPQAPIKCNACKFTPKSLPSCRVRPVYKYIKTGNTGPDTASQIYKTLYSDKERYRLLSESQVQEISELEAKYKDTISKLRAASEMLVQNNHMAIAENKFLKEKWAESAGLKKLVDTMHTIQYLRSYISNPELPQLLLQLRASYNFGRPGYNVGGGIEYKVDRLGINGAIFYNPVTDQFTKAIGARYDLFRTRIK